MYVDVIEKERERERYRGGEREWKGEDRGRKGGIPEIITQENDAREWFERRTQNYYLLYYHTKVNTIEIQRI